MERIPVKHLDYTTYPSMMMPNFMGNRYEREEAERMMPPMNTAASAPLAAPAAPAPTAPIQIEPKLLKE
jgi:hypothetical protein